MQAIVDAASAVLAVLGIALIVWAAPLSVRYNAWTTHLREHHPNFNPPATPEWRQRNTKIMIGVFRVMGMVVVVLSFLLLMVSINLR